MDQDPLSEPLQLNRQLQLDNSTISIALRRTDPNSTTLPGQARVELNALT
jgi:hypothetical protein